MRRWLGWAAKLYPKAWRDRYGREFDSLLDVVEPRWTDVTDVLRGAAAMQMRSVATYLKIVGGVAAAGAITAMVASFLLPALYVSSAIVQGDRGDGPESHDRMAQAWQDVMTRGSLAEVIQRPTLDLYQAQRRHVPLEDVIDDMKSKDVKLEFLKNRDSAIKISFVYPDRYKAQAVVAALTQKMIDASRARWTVASASLPAVPVSPDRWAFLLSGLGIGLLAGAIASFFRWRARWTLMVMGFGLAGCVIAAALSWLIPNRYTSTATLRVTVKPDGGAQRYLDEAAMAGWLHKKESEILSDESLYEIMRRSTLDLYRTAREDGSIQAAVGMMRRNLTIEAPHSHGSFSISFTYEDRLKAQATVSALVMKFVDSEVVRSEADLMGYHAPRRSVEDCIGKKGDDYTACVSSFMMPGVPRVRAAPPQRRGPETLELLDPPSLPETPVAPNRFIVAGIGLLAGLLLGGFTLNSRAATLGSVAHP